MIYVNTRLPKLCHAQPGQKVRLPDPATGAVLPEVFMVVAVAERLRGRTLRPARKGISLGLYDDERPLMLVSMSTGVAQPMPHLSSRAEILRDTDTPAPKALPNQVVEAVKAERLAVINHLRDKHQDVAADFIQEGLHVTGSAGDMLTPYEEDWRDPNTIPAWPPHAGVSTVNMPAHSAQ